MKRPARLTEGFVESIDRIGVYGDGRGGYGLKLAVRESARGGVRKMWIQRIRIDEKNRELGLGGYPVVSLMDARAIALDNARRVQAIKPNPLDRFLSAAPAPVVSISAPAPAPVDVPTFGEAYERNIQLRLAKWQTNTRGRSSSEMQWRGKYKNYLADTIGELPINEISSRTIQELLEPLWTAKPTVANDICSYANIVFEWAIGMEYITSNPVVKARKALGGKPGSEKQAHRKALPHSDIARWYASIECTTGMEAAKNAMRFLILTATRKEEVLAAKWGEIDFKAKTWTIPGGRGGRMKAGIDHVVPLPAIAIEVLYQSLRDTTDPDAYIFATQRKDGKHGAKMIASGTLNGMVKRVNSLTELEAVPHGFRSTFRDWAAEMTDYPREIVELCLAHDDSSKVERAYRHTDYLEKRRAVMGNWADYIMPNC